VTRTGRTHHLDGGFLVTVPARALVDWVPPTGPPAVLMKIWFSVSGLCQYCGATSITT